MSFQFVLTNQVFHQVIAISAKTRFKNEANMHSLFFLFVVDEKIQKQCTPFSPKSSLAKGPLCHLICIFVYNLAISAINCHFCHFSQICHFRQYRHFPQGPFAIVFEFLLTVLRFWRLSAISAIFVKYANFANIAILQRAPLPSHLNFCLQSGDFGD